jgi:hypothetical protein
MYCQRCFSPLVPYLTNCVPYRRSCSSGFSFLYFTYYSGNIFSLLISDHNKASGPVHTIKYYIAWSEISKAPGNVLIAIGAPAHSKADRNESRNLHLFNGLECLP